MSTRTLKHGMQSLFICKHVLNILSYRAGDVEEHVTDPSKKNEFLSDLEQLEAGKIEGEVRLD